MRSKLPLSASQPFHAFIVAALNIAVALLAGCSNEPSYVASPAPPLTTGSISSTLSPRLPRSVTVQPGDTLYRIAHRHNVTVYDLKTVNVLTNDRIALGQVLYLPAY
jgi:hypothetical protein